MTPPIRIMLNHKPSRMASLSLLGLLISHVFMVTRNCSAFHLPTTPSVRVCSVGTNNNNIYHAQAALPSTSSKRTSSTRCNISHLQMMSSSNNMNNMIPSAEEVVQQKQEAYTALASFHETAHSLTQSSSSQLLSLMKGVDTGGDEEDGDEVKAEYWSCNNGAISYSVPMDPAAGLKKGVISKPYKCSVQVEMDLGELAGRSKRTGLRLVESIQFTGNDDDGNGSSSSSSSSSLPFVRSIPLGANVDVDAVDGSYSLDDTIVQSLGDSPSLPLLPPSLLVGVVDPTAVQFLVEHTLATSETERFRCFLLYGDDSLASGKSNHQGGENEGDDGDEGAEEDFAVLAAAKSAETKEKSHKKGSKSERGKTERNYRLLGVILAEETKVMPEKVEPTDDKNSSDDGDVDYASDFISQMIESPASSESSSSPLDLLQIDQTGESEDDKMKQLMQSLDKHNTRVMESAAGDIGSGSDNTKMEPHSLSMFGLTSGVWLGDTFVRESLPSTFGQALQKGFGKKGSSPSDGDSEEDRFATWCMGVQKCALQFEWDDTSVTQQYTYGKVLGTATSLSSMANIKSDGVVAVNEARRMKKREEKRVIWDMEGGAYVAGLIGPSYFRAPRYMAFSQSRSYSADAYLTEFMVFQRPVNDESSSKNLGTVIDLDAAEEYYCSRTSRLYNSNDGSLMQGSTAFFSMTQPPVDAPMQ